MKTYIDKLGITYSADRKTLIKGSRGVEHLRIPDTVTTIGKYAFDSCENLRSIEFSDSLLEIKRYAFYGCYGLESICLPNSVSSIGEGAFESSHSLKSVVINNYHVNISPFAFPSSCVLQVPKTYLNEFRDKYADYWKIVEHGHMGFNSNNISREIETENTYHSKKKLWYFMSISDYNHLLDGLIEAKNKAENAHPLLQEFFTINIEFLSKKISKEHFIRRCYIAEIIYDEGIKVVDEGIKYILDSWRMFLDLEGHNGMKLKSMRIIKSMRYLI